MENEYCVRKRIRNRLPVGLNLDNGSRCLLTTLGIASHLLFMYLFLCLLYFLVIYYLLFTTLVNGLCFWLFGVDEVSFSRHTTRVSQFKHRSLIFRNSIRFGLLNHHALTLHLSPCSVFSQSELIFMWHSESLQLIKLIN